jgi:hypothetical protein
MRQCLSESVDFTSRPTGKAAAVDFQEAGANGCLVHGFSDGGAVRRRCGLACAIAALQILTHPSVIGRDVLA